VDRAAYLATVQAESSRFAAAAAAARHRHGWRARVPACPEWDLADLVWHLGEVQHFWAWIVGTRAPSPEGYAQPVRPADDALLAWAGEQSRNLWNALTHADPAEPVWTWARQQDVAFVLRRQAQEAVVHTADVELVAEDLRPIPPEVGLDGIDEWLEVFVPSALPQGPPASAHPVVLHAVDADAERTLFAGTRPFPVAALTGTAGDLLLAAWRRVPVEVLTVDGDGLQAAAMIGLVRRT
jgi:uncharacterized protein (TIGR03083 family)